MIPPKSAIEAGLDVANIAALIAGLVMIPRIASAVSGALQKSGSAAVHTVENAVHLVEHHGDTAARNLGHMIANIHKKAADSEKTISSLVASNK